MTQNNNTHKKNNVNLNLIYKYFNTYLNNGEIENAKSLLFDSVLIHKSKNHMSYFITQIPELFLLLEEETQNDFEFCLSLTKKCPIVYTYFNEDFKNNNFIINSVLESNGECLKYMPLHISNDIHFVKMAIKSAGIHCLQHTPKKIRENQQYLIECIELSKESPLSINYISIEMLKRITDKKLFDKIISIIDIKNDFVNLFDIPTMLSISDLFKSTTQLLTLEAFKQYNKNIVKI